MLYKIALFFHVIGALMLCAAIAIEWLCIVNLRKANTEGRIQESVSDYSKLSKIGGVVMALILIPGIYMMITTWRDASWIMISFLGIILMGTIGGVVTGRRMSTLRKMIKNGSVGSAALKGLVNHNALWISLRMRTAIFLGIIFLMTVKLGLAGSIITLMLSIVLGIIPIKMKPAPTTAN